MVDEYWMIEIPIPGSTLKLISLSRTISTSSNFCTLITCTTLSRTLPDFRFRWVSHIEEARDNKSALKATE